MNGGAIDQSKASKGTKKKSCPKKKMGPSATENTENEGTLIWDLITGCTQIALTLIGGLGIAWFGVITSHYLIEREDRLMLEEACKELDDSINGIASLKGKVKGKWVELAGDVKAIVKDDMI